MIYTLYFNPTIDKTLYFDSFVVGGTNRPSHIVVDGAGKAVNVSVVLSELGCASTCFGIVFDGDSEIIKNRLEKHKVSYIFDEYPGFSRVNTKIFDKSTKKTTEINESGLVLKEDEYKQISDRLLETVMSGDTVVLTGSIPSGAPQTLYASLISELNLKNVKCVLDASGDALVSGVNSSPYIIKPNSDEIALICEECITKDNVKKILLMCAEKFGIRYVALSLGKDGAYLADGNDVYFAAALDVDVLSTVGAGDSMIAGFLYGIDKGTEYALRCGVAAATGSIIREGTSLMKYEDFNRLIGKVVAKKI